MTMIANYGSKKECKSHIGNELDYIETSWFGPQYKSNGILTVINRPHITGKGHEWSGLVTMKDGLIVKVE